MTQSAEMRIEFFAVHRWCLMIGGCVLLSLQANADWPQFRGPNSSGVADSGSVPVEFGPGQNELWHVPVAPGHSSPCIVGKSIFLTTFDEEQKRLSLVCLDRTDGKTRWQRHVSVETMEKGHPSFNPASSSPTCDGERVVAYFGSFGLICFDLNGNKQWELRMPMTKSFAGNATSPIIAGDRVILYRGNYIDHYLLAVDKKTGEELWKIPQDEKFTGEMACTSCPIVSGDKLIVHSARSVQAFDVANGKQLWMTKCATTATSTPVICGDEVIVAAWNKMGEPELKPPFPTFDELVAAHDQDDDKLISRVEFPELWIFHRPEGIEAPMNGGKVHFERVDRDKDQQIGADEWAVQVKDLEKFRAGYGTHGLLAIPINSEGIVAPDKVRTLETQGISEVPSPLCDGPYVYFVKNGGILTCMDVRTGERVYRIRTPGRGTHYASPVIADDKLFTLSGDGRVTVLTLGPDPKILATNEMQDGVYASPAVVDGTIYVRTHSALFAFQGP
ncbi:MAG: PQQ-binding-like beta-propeller repeat protein [Fuerstiella sp.]|nr:PQQ-binding-like beta-propeller repeat protein [Fuerstiella sp.]MCP4854130.1 PQQ-binding-like beta-propeller repeat protein [Fuerstiella sp.]